MSELASATEPTTTATGTESATMLQPGESQAATDTAADYEREQAYVLQLEIDLATQTIDDYVEQLPGSPTWDTDGFIQIVNGGGQLKTVAYFSRDGHSLPQPN